ncbi:protein of unknown function [Methylorubrum extorquens]|uniref:Uncharacterized protein n=1 Tax=Methylorubrum extorquens TaxID=408 RepID=A0A2N9ANS7_METEX|nr:hypothetical protein [Methylorubrum zatmanii]MCP1559095.1 hypothetical protein [Methylorubrum extorquens]MDF9864422.1 hypothetical protein [Methylorubrum pseudosasae]MDH6638009.1 hypothetical protein [Methylobacterium sp. SuP10 SLI 274]MDF9792732.1 hypothetical protein [Methylorubrum extorquens]MDH6667191.1 hypothetical protein [Methylorubrum zatmanii]
MAPMRAVVGLPNFAPRMYPDPIRLSRTVDPDASGILRPGPSIPDRRSGPVIATAREADPVSPVIRDAR